MSFPVNGVATYAFDATNGEEIHWGIQDDFQWGEAGEAAGWAAQLTTDGSVEDAYNAIAYTYGSRAFRDDAIVNVVLLTDESNNGYSGTTREDVISLFDGSDAVFTAVTGVNFTSDNAGSQQILGIDSLGRAFLPDGSGGFTEDAGASAVERQWLRRPGRHGLRFR